MRISKLIAAGLASSLVACAGVSIAPLSRDEANNAHKTGSSVKGYVVHAPVVVVEVSRGCIGKEDKACEATEIQCKAGTPFVMPDYSRPFLVDVKSGFGKAGVDVTLTNGWLLSSIKDNSDNTALPLGLLNKLPVLKTSNVTDAANSKDCLPGLYRLEFDAKDGTLKLAHMPYR
jgi:hypothetical protein